MSMFKKLALAAIVTAAPAGAFAADAIAFPVSTEAAMPVYDDSGFDWTGFYAGVYGVVNSSPINGLQYGPGVVVGGNVALDFFLVGGEVAFHGLLGGAGDTSYAQALVKAGVLVTDDVLLYGAAGYGIDTGMPVQDHVLLGGGVEMAVADNISLRAQYLHGFPITGANPTEQVTLGANFHF